MGDVQAASVRPMAVVTNMAEALDASGLDVFTVINFPSDGVASSQLTTMIPVTKENVVRSSALAVMVVARGKIDDHTLKAWTFPLDAHRFYVLRVGEMECLVYDVMTKQWSVWEGAGGLPWRARTGLAWLGAGPLRSEYGSNIVAGDDRTGWLWFVAPEERSDENDDATAPNQPFKRSVVGQVLARGRTPVPCFEVYLTASGGQPALTGASVVLRTSDDAGHTFADHGAITISLGDYTQEFAWRSLGQVTAPGRLFWFEDDGAFQRIDSMELEDGNQ